jgi:heme exporter protein D
MSDKPIISAENVPTVAAVAFVLALLSLGYGFYVHRQVNITAVGAVALDVRAAKRDTEFEKEITALKERVAKLEAQPMAAPPLNATVAETAPAAPTEAPKK